MLFIYLSYDGTETDNFIGSSQVYLSSDLPFLVNLRRLVNLRFRSARNCGNFSHDAEYPLLLADVSASSQNKENGNPFKAISNELAKKA